MAQVEMSKDQLQELMQAAVRGGVSAAMEQLAHMNPLEQRRFDEEIAKDKRRELLSVELAKNEEEAQRRKRDGCSHSIDRQTGEPVMRGTGQWKTGGQAYQDGTAALFCLRCQTVWRWRPSPEQYSVIVQNGLYGGAPPPDDQVLCNGCLRLKRMCRCEEDYRKQRSGVAA